MIIGLVRGDIFGTPLSNIVFAVNSDGINDSGFAGQVSRRFWPELAYIGPQPLGTVLTRTNGKTYQSFGPEFTLKFGRWTGDRLGFFCWNETGESGWIDVDWFTYAYDGPKAAFDSP